MAQAARTGSTLSRIGPVDASIALVVFLTSFAYFQRTLHITLDLKDEGFLLFNIARASRGEIPHRDFLEVYGPGVYALTAPVFHFFGDRVLPVREVLAVFRASAVAFSYVIARHFTPRPFALLGAFVAMAYWGRSIWLLTTPYAALFTVPLCMLSLLLLLRAEDRGDRRGYIGSGLVCGVAMLFKWSLAATSAYGMVLAIAASGVLREPAVASRRSFRIPVIAAAGLAGGASLLPFLAILTPRDYLLHFAPFHILLLLLAIRFFRSGDGADWFAYTAPRAIRYAAGFAVAPLAVAAFYFASGALGDLFYNTIQRPLHYVDYYSAVPATRVNSFLLLACIVAWISSVLALMRNSRRLAIACFALAVATTPFGYFASRASGSVSLALAGLTQVLPALVAFSALPFVALGLLRPGDAAARRPLVALIAALFFQAMLAFQIYPRAGYPVILILGTLAPVAAYLCHRWYQLAAPDGLPHRSVAFVLVASLPLLFVSGAIRSAFPPDLSWSGVSDVRPDTSLHAPVLAGIRPKQEDYEREEFAAFDSLIIELEAALPADAPLFVIQNEAMIYLASGRRHLFADHALILFLAGWGLLPEDDRDRPPVAAMIERLEKEPETIVVSRRGNASVRNFSRHFPELARYIRENYAVENRIRSYRILRRRSGS